MFKTQEVRKEPSKEDAKTLDKSRPYGTIHGGEGAARFEQGGKKFDFGGKEVR
jgi:hypothetical protein